ncbi:MAG: cysteine desulfurase family protein [Anaerolineales bacterium]|nr:cysteine desulfurase [Anaerolineales bacterium]MCS7247228.1 cysteine desulfurase [Anaerolineales bacterium]MDW8161039.1 cysteine desulfurase family protein [Anaerolineales bacterium]MDW8447306.1 cysteine desulfurase family protein [Anaerolineales bacterium]
MANKVNQVYLDYAATTPMAEEAFEAMLPYFREEFGNPSSLHRFGQRAEAALEEARETVARHLNCDVEEVIFTSGGTESDNLALRGCALARQRQNGANHILISAVEHHAVSHTAEQLAHHFGFEVETLPVDSQGMVSPEEVRKRIRPETALVSIIYANNEIGTINRIDEIGKICREEGIPFHTDAVQATAYLPLDVNRLNIDLLSLGAHKFYGPKGIGVLYLRKDTPFISLQTGGGQEWGRRSGTPNVPYIVGMSAALKFVKAHQDLWKNTLVRLRDRLIEEVLAEIPNSQLTGHRTQRLPNHASFVFEGVESQRLVALLDNEGFACSSASACKTGNPSPSAVLLALGLPRELAMGSLRVTLGKDTSEEDLDGFIRCLKSVIARLRR